MKKIKYYNPDLSIEENAIRNGVTQQAIRKYLRSLGLSRRDERAYDFWHKVHGMLRSKDKYYTIQEIAEILKCSPTTVKHYKNMSEPPAGKEIMARYNEMVKYMSENPNATVEMASMALHMDESMIKRFLKLGQPGQGASMYKEEEMMTHIKSISSHLGEILMNILRLHVKASTFDCDLTFGEGRFYSKTGIPKPEEKIDKYPSGRHKDITKLKDLEGVLTEHSALYKSIVIDLPTLIAGNPFPEGTSVNPNPEKYAFKSVEDMKTEYGKMMSMAYKLLYPGGIMVFTTTDIPMEDHMVWASYDAQTIAHKIGFEHIDTFILDCSEKLSKNKKNLAKHAARVAQLSFFVFRKPGILSKSI